MVTLILLKQPASPVSPESRAINRADARTLQGLLADTQASASLAEPSLQRCSSIQPATGSNSQPEREQVATQESISLLPTPNERVSSTQPPSQVHSRLNISKASPREVHDWQQRIFRCASEDGNDGLEISGPTAKSIASTLLDLLGYYYPHNEDIVAFQPVPGVRCRMQGLSAFFQQFHSIEMCVLPSYFCYALLI